MMSSLGIYLSSDVLGFDWVHISVVSLVTILQEAEVHVSSGRAFPGGRDFIIITPLKASYERNVHLSLLKKSILTHTGVHTGLLTKNRLQTKG